jgi:hypothetical protein
VSTRGHEIPVKNQSPGGVGESWIVHAAPFQLSTRVPASEPPTAVHPVEETQETPGSDANPTPDGLGAGDSVHDEPSQLSARARTTPDGGCFSPVAIQELEEEQEIPPRKL